MCDTTEAMCDTTETMLAVTLIGWSGDGRIC
jgi:hypothetical protein